MIGRSFFMAWIASVFITLACVQADPQAFESHPPWQELFDGKQLAPWQATAFGGEAEVRIENGRLLLPFGFPLTGITWQGEPPFRLDYELELVAARLDGSDFFCGLTFPVGEEFLTLILGGWGGATCGLSCLDGEDASANESVRYRRFETGKDYRIRIQVRRHRIQVWLDDEAFLDQDLSGRRLSLRPEVSLSRPLGIASFATSTSLASIRWRPLGSLGRTSP
ncbi:MAG: DUF1080 domain-containing protein [Planctomycetota bacterium]|nr:MAG: DUF1080 domain-containing protein [Planctomycetota bacterium]